MTSRRIFIKTSGGLALVACVGGLSALIESCTSKGLPFTVENNTIKVLKEKVKLGKFYLIESDKTEEPIYLMLEDGDYYALLLKCTHKGCELEPGTTLIHCPCHGGKYTPKGEVISGPPPRPLKRYPVTTDNTYVYITLQS
jgi:cytochrome b6-f complex iron-sulfur subunit